MHKILLSAYEQARQRNIERNRVLLDKLGLPSASSFVRLPSSSASVSAWSSPLTASVSASASHRRPSQKRKRPPLATAQHQAVRRSARLCSVAPVDYRDVPETMIHSRSRSRRSSSTDSSQSLSTEEPAAVRRWQVPSPDSSDHIGSVTKLTAPTNTKGQAKKTKVPVSSRELSVDVGELRRLWLGRQFESTGKQTVVSCATHSQVRFSKLQGHLLWENAVFLWTNLAQPNNRYQNPFTLTRANRNRTGPVPGTDHPTDTTTTRGQSAATKAASLNVNTKPEPSLDQWLQQPPTEPGSLLLSMTWYASPSTRADSPVIRRLLTHDEQVHLFCRLLPTEPYIYFGRLELDAVDLERRPFAFRYLLTDTDALMAHSEAAVPAILQLAQLVD
eukprot:CAMPEP_0177648126 /NCGR_PEP_ID=MMETSP0447-20121125/10664_1 /TAXON_ID=0 /ORGANISM="Stygamoeba regulata, Strain BSH-02190019" /LENGTH=388 /DNA_ID=CAMNT_0019150751 /DNA_START=84 /DNA_END=1250 /DNA_ORIENTATION=+